MVGRGFSRQERNVPIEEVLEESRLLTSIAKKRARSLFIYFFFLMCEAAKKGNTANIHCDAAVSYIKKRQARGA
jgi:hypothetical protein